MMTMSIFYYYLILLLLRIGDFVFLLYDFFFVLDRILISIRAVGILCGRKATNVFGLLPRTLELSVVLTRILPSVPGKVVFALSCLLRATGICATSFCFNLLHRFSISSCVGFFRLARVYFLTFLSISTKTSLQCSWCTI